LSSWYNLEEYVQGHPTREPNYGFHVKRPTLRIRLLTANDPAAAYSWTVSLLAISGGTHAMGVYGFGRSTVVVDIAQMKVKNFTRVVCLWSTKGHST